LAASCVGTASSPEAEGITPAVLERLGLGPVEDPVWKREVAGLELLGLSAAADSRELELLEAAFEELPPGLVEEAAVRNLVRDSGVAGTPLEPTQLAFTRGPDIYVIERTFSESGSTRMGMAKVLAHELAHAAQFATIDKAYVDAVLSGDVTVVDPTAASVSVRDFADATGWMNASSDLLQPAWQASPGVLAGTTEYGRTSPSEDLADSVAAVAIGQANTISPDRVAWVEKLIGSSAVNLAKGKPWVPAGSTVITSANPIYDEAVVASFGKQHADPWYFQLPADEPPAAELATEITAELRLRDLSGELERVDDERLPRYAGRFLRDSGLEYWVELWDFREATLDSGVPLPVLTYVVLW
jgi:hypothetical protein